MAKGRTRKGAQEGKLEISAQLFDELTRLASRPRPVVKAQRTKRRPSKYNIYVQQEMKKLKEANPNMSVQDRFKRSVQTWKQCRDSAVCMGGLPKKLDEKTSTRSTPPRTRTNIARRR